MLCSPFFLDTLYAHIQYKLRAANEVVMKCTKDSSCWKTNNKIQYFRIDRSFEWPRWSNITLKSWFRNQSMYIRLLLKKYSDIYCPKWLIYLFFYLIKFRQFTVLLCSLYISIRIWIFTVVVSSKRLHPYAIVRSLHGVTHCNWLNHKNNGIFLKMVHRIKKYFVMFVWRYVEVQNLT